MASEDQTRIKIGTILLKFDEIVRWSIYLNINVDQFNEWYWNVGEKKLDKSDFLNSFSFSSQDNGSNWITIIYNRDGNFEIKIKFLLLWLILNYCLLAIRLEKKKGKQKINKNLSSSSSIDQ